MLPSRVALAPTPQARAIYIKPGSRAIARQNVTNDLREVWQEILYRCPFLEPESINSDKQ